MKAILALFIALTTAATGADRFSMFFRYGSGTRVDYSNTSPDGKSSEDTFPESAVVHVLIPENSNEAQISLAYGIDAAGREDQSYRGVVIHRSQDMISVVCKFGPLDKVENFVIFPKRGSAFLVIYSAYLGRDAMKAMAASNPGIPYGSVSMFRLKQLEK